MPRRCLEHGLDQLKRPSSTYSFGAMELAIFVAVKLHAPASRARPDPAGMAHKECTMLTAWSCSAQACGAPCQACDAGKSGRSLLVEAELTVSSQRVCSGITCVFVRFRAGRQRCVSALCTIRAIPFTLHDPRRRAEGLDRGAGLLATAFSIQ